MLQRFKNWWAKPFNSDMDATGWFLFFGLLIVISVLWGLVIREIKEIAD